MNEGKMPVLFVGHGSPMNAIEDNEFARAWEELPARLPRPRAILAISAHWFGAGIKIADQAKPRQIYDMYGFPPELYALKYPAIGDPSLAKKAQALVGPAAHYDESWGLDHGIWAVLARMYPQADIPVTAMSVDVKADPLKLIETGKRLRPLREEGVLILGSGNIVHNLSLVDMRRRDGFPWADEFDGWVKSKIMAKSFANVANYGEAGPSSHKAFSTPEHFYPLLYVLGAADLNDGIDVFNDKRIMGAASMTSYLFH